jgi:S1-C subfamily serine protease
VTANLPALGGANDIRAVRAAIVVVCLLAFVGGCGGESAPPPRPAPSRPPPARVEEQKPPPGTLWREDVDAAIQAGVGRFLHDHVEVEPAFDNGAFSGFRIVRLEPPDFWQGVDLAPGDVVTAVNGMPIERDTQAYDALMALKTAKELRVSYLRGGQERALVFAIAPRK